MNDRFRQLAEQAGTWEYFNAEDEKTKAMDEQALQNFAELIVRECMRVSMKAAGLDAEYEAWYLIKEHFGVEL